MDCCVNLYKYGRCWQLDMDFVAHKFSWEVTLHPWWFRGLWWRSEMQWKLFQESITVVAVLVCCFSIGDALKCHVCTSSQNAECMSSEFMLKNNTYLRECPQNATVCSRILEEYMTGPADPPVVTRRCDVTGNVTHCNLTTTTTGEFLTTVCYCNTDGCNHGNGLISRIPLLKLCLVFVMILLSDWNLHSAKRTMYPC